MPIKLPDETERISIVGRTGSGKTIAALWHLSQRDIETRPWIIYNFKGDKNIDAIPHTVPLDLNHMPTKPGVYVVRPNPAQYDDVESQLWEIWAREKIGVYIDEGYMIGNRNAAFRALLTQGRSKEIPMIVLSQRPVHLDRFVFSESEYFQVFALQHKKDLLTVNDFIPHDLSKRLPKHHSYYYDVSDDKLTKLAPVPPLEELLTMFDRRLSRVRKTV